MIPALILAGGQATRFGHADKAFLRLAGQPLLAHLLAALAPQIQTIAISANGEPARFAAYNLPVLPDAPADAGKGPLAGLKAGLLWAASIGAAALLTIPVDTPFIPPDFAARLTPAPAVATWRGRQHHLAASWPVSALSSVAASLANPGPYRVRDLLAVIAARQIAFDDHPADPFLNLNTPADLAIAQSYFT